MNEFPEADNCAEWLGPPTTTGGATALRQVLLTKTTRIVRRRMWLKRAGILVALAACYGAGLLTMHWATPNGGQAEMRVAKASVEPDAKKSEPQVEVSPPAEASAEILERWALLVAREQRSAFFRRAGDRYYDRHNDLEGALRCYRAALDAGSEDDLQVAAEDNWLLMALKEARSKEKHNGSTN